MLLQACGGGGAGTPTNATIADSGANAQNALNPSINTAPEPDTTAVTNPPTGDHQPTAAAAESEPAINPDSASNQPAVTIETTLSSAAVQPSESSVTQALNSGDAQTASAAVLLDAAVLEGQRQVNQCHTILNQVYPDGLVEADYPYLANHVFSSSERNYPLHVASDNAAVYAWLGERDSGSRFAYYGAGIFTSTDSHYWGNLGTELVDNTRWVIDWLTEPHTDPGAVSQPLRIQALSARAADQLSRWQQLHLPQANWQIVTNADTSATHTYDLVIALAGGELNGIETVLEAGKSLLLFSEVFNPGGGIHKLGLHWNWWGEGVIGNADTVASQCELAYAPANLLKTLETLQTGNLDFTTDDNNCPTHIYTRQCRPTEVLRTDGQSLQDVFMAGVEDLRLRLSQMDAANRSVFADDQSDQLLKLAVLLGDKFRTATSYPIDHVESPAEDFYRALFADYANHYSRTASPAQMDNGDFAPNTEQIAALAGEQALIQLPLTEFADWNSTGFTARAGKAVTLTRQDQQSATVSVKINMLRSHATKIWNDYGYTRPLFTESHSVLLPAGESVTLSSPIGGPVYIHWDATADTGTDIEPGATIDIHLSGVVSHPLLKSFSSEDVQRFADRLRAQPFDWVDIKTPFAEIHSRRDYMLRSFNQQHSPDNTHTTADVQHWVSDLNDYLIESALALAGFVDPSLNLSLDTEAFCQARQLDCDDSQLHKKPALQHVIADLRASCGDLCSGNPFDTNAPVNPLGFGEAHEMGHNLQRSRLNFYGARSLESSNNIFPHYTAWRWLQDQALEQHPFIRLPDPQKSYEQLQQSVLFASEPGIGHPIWADSQIYVNADVRLELYLQLAYIHHQWESPELTDATGWNLYTRLYKLEREFTRALSSETRWNLERDKLGFSAYNRSEASTISGNDFMAVALSLIGNRDHRDYLSVWGIDISDQASAQIDSNGFSGTVTRVFWRTPDDRYARYRFPSDDPANALPLDGVTEW